MCGTLVDLFMVNAKQHMCRTFVDLCMVNTIQNKCRTFVVPYVWLIQRPKHVWDVGGPIYG